VCCVPRPCVCRAGQVDAAQSDVTRTIRMSQELKRTVYDLPIEQLAEEERATGKIPRQRAGSTSSHPGKGSVSGGGSPADREVAAVFSGEEAALLRQPDPAKPGTLTLLLCCLLCTVGLWGCCVVFCALYTCVCVVEHGRGSGCVLFASVGWAAVLAIGTHPLPLSSLGFHVHAWVGGGGLTVQ
jgi:hypothetical protein